MPEYIDHWSDEQMTRLTRKLKRVYKEATDELTEVASAYFKTLEQRYLEQYAAYQDGMYTDEQFDEWYMAQVGRGKRWEALRDDMASRMTAANVIASKYMNTMAAGVMAELYNWSAYLIEDHQKKYGSDTYKSISFNLLDANTVKRLSGTKGLTMLPKARIDIPKDEQWNKQKLQNSLLQGILQGKDVNEIAKHLSDSVGHMNEVSAMRNARTMLTEAQNAGRQMNFEEAEKMGIPMEKEWISNTDDRVRSSHAQLDGVRVPVKDYFPNGCEYPGDHRGDPAEVYNCRCSMRAVFLDYKNGKEARYSNTPKARGYHTEETYKAWKFEKVISAGKNGMRKMPTIGTESEYNDLKRAYISNNLPQAMSMNDFSEWCKEIGISIVPEGTQTEFYQYGNANEIDGRLLAVFKNRFSELNEKYPYVAEFYEKNNGYGGYMFGLAKDDAFLAEASYGMAYGAIANDAEELFSAYIDGIQNGFFTGGDNTLNGLMDHEFGHGIYMAMLSRSSDEEADKMTHDLYTTLFGLDGFPRYAEETDEEMFSEGFKAWYNNEGTDFANAFGEWFERWKL